MRVSVPFEGFPMSGGCVLVVFLWYSGVFFCGPVAEWVWLRREFVVGLGIDLCGEFGI